MPKKQKETKEKPKLSRFEKIIDRIVKAATGTAGVLLIFALVLGLIRIQAPDLFRAAILQAGDPWDPLAVQNADKQCGLKDKQTLEIHSGGSEEYFWNFESTTMVWDCDDCSDSDCVDGQPIYGTLEVAGASGTAEYSYPISAPIPASDIRNVDGEDIDVGYIDSDEESDVCVTRSLYYISYSGNMAGSKIKSNKESQTPGPGCRPERRGSQCSLSIRSDPGSPSGKCLGNICYRS